MGDFFDRFLVLRWLIIPFIGNLSKPHPIGFTVFAVDLETLSVIDFIAAKEAFDVEIVDVDSSVAEGAGVGVAVG